ncbi:hypothetical protein FMV56_000610 [Enterococcus faecalis]|uniref:hypothetical protein n=1 Tax=Enterococcus phage EFC-1 TaxID=1486428 RepID=UPI000517B946|nr:hypothetical protein [Enterococcus faecalis]YP_009103063.1 hypothetical protein PI32_gp27 [Enterococcus phage EFC-1]AIS73964.1 hypothetical protein [Enterococcus phage EFC-1]EGO7728067.1 hypothetical protein [Enterococcus faecalis]EGO7752007.1 hypothetical protein [Enterococcus faecalis]EGS7943317.1 hypothetical protein [Enterococcus faecalis]EGS8048242.1 hypothetical protein [Enterococcus faecalis]
MPEIKVTFADGSTEVFHEDQTFTSIVKLKDKDNDVFYPSLSANYSLWRHHHNHLTPSFVELLANSEYFYDIEKPDIIYSSNSIVKFELL